MKIQHPAGRIVGQAALHSAPLHTAPQIKVRTDLLAGETCQEQTRYWHEMYNQLNREFKRRGCTQ